MRGREGAAVERALYRVGPGPERVEEGLEARPQRDELKCLSERGGARWQGAAAPRRRTVLRSGARRGE